jgi:hypothetical protein
LKAGQRGEQRGTGRNLQAGVATFDEARRQLSQALPPLPLGSLDFEAQLAVERGECEQRADDPFLPGVSARRLAQRGAQRVLWIG